MDGKNLINSDLALLDILFDHVPVALAIWDCEFRLLRCNLTWAEYIVRYTAAQAADVVPGVGLFELAPEIEPAIMPHFRRVLAGETVELEALRLESAGIVSYWDASLRPLWHGGQVIGIVNVHSDATGRIAAQETLRAERDRLARIMETSPAGILVFDATGHIVEANRRAGEVLGLERGQMIGHTSSGGEWKIFDEDGAPLPPDQMPFRQVMAGGGAVDGARIGLERPDGSRMLLSVSGAPLHDETGALSGMVATVEDIRGQVAATQSLEQRVEERTHENTRLYEEAMRRADENQTLMAVQQAITSRLDRDAVLQLIADEARRLTRTRLSFVHLIDGEWLRGAIKSGDDGDRFPDDYSVPLDNSRAGLAIRTGQPQRVNDARHDPVVYADAVERGQIGAFIIVPLLSESGPLGTISVADKAEGQFDADDERILTMLARAAVIGLENARLYEQEKERRRVAEGLREILALLNANQSLDETLQGVVEQASRLLDTSAGAIYLLDTDQGDLYVAAARGLADDYRALRLPVGKAITGQAVAERRPVPYASTRDRAPLRDIARELPEGWQDKVDSMSARYASLLAVPLIVKDTVYGAITLYYDEPQAFPPDEIALAVTFADQAALVIENARLRQQAQQAAAAGERSRLARDLHDAVTQTLFAASIIAEVLPRLWERDREEATRRLNELRQLTRGALAEMRTLLLELRPAALTDSDLSELLRQLVEATVGRARVEIDLKVDDTKTRSRQTSDSPFTASRRRR